jgi:acyl-CoA hydrolase
MANRFEREYGDRLIPAEQAAGLVKSGDSIHFGGAAYVATIIDKYLAGRKSELENVTVRSYIDTARYRICDADPEGEVFKWHSGFVSQSDVNEEIIVVEGNVADEIISAATDHACDVIVMESRQRSLLAEAFSGSVVRKVLRRAKKPVLVVPLPELSEIQMTGVGGIVTQGIV